MRDDEASFWDAGPQRARAAFDLLDSYVSKVDQTTVPIFRQDSTGRLESIGSAVLLALGDEAIVLTAAHVLDEATETTALLVGSHDSLVRLQGKWFKTPLQKGGVRDQDRVDVGAVWLPRSARAKLHDSCLLATGDLALFRPMKHRSYALLAGYPCSKQVSRGQRDLESSLCTVMAECSADEDYAGIGVSSTHAVVLAFDRMQVWRREGRSIAPKLQGMSGGGLWILQRSTPDQAGSARLCGTIIEWRNGAKTLLVATRIEVLLSGIWGHWPELRAFLPADERREE